jgi:hypothetical protein
MRAVSLLLALSCSLSGVPVRTPSGESYANQLSWE